MKSSYRGAIAWLSACLLVLSGAANSANLTRGPYLQLETPDSIVVRWRTDQTTDSVVRFGSAPGSLTAGVNETGSTAEHVVEITELQPNTRYYYSVGDSSSTLAGDDTSHFFVTAPTPGTEKATRIWVIGDSGTADANARAVRDAYKNYTGGRGTDLWLMLGDNAYNSGTDSEYQAAVFDTYPELLRQVALWPTLGNHDGYTADSSTQSGPYYDMFTLPTAGEAGGLASGTEAYYSFDYANIHFICLESYETDRSVGGAMMRWLQDDLAQNDKPWVIAFWHHPPYTKGSHNSDTESNLIDMRQNALPILDAWGVDMVLSGHSHSYERSYLLDGHYGSSTTLDASMILDGGDGRENGDGAYEKPLSVAVANEGAVYAVAGSSGKISGGSLDHPAMYISLNTLGSMVVDVAGNRLDAAFVDSTGAVRDSFTVTKGQDTTPPALVSAEALDDISIRVQFSEPLDQTSAETVTNYVIDQGVTVAGASLGGDGRSVTLDTSVLAEGVTYTLTVDNVDDVAGNPITANSQAQFSFVTLVTKSFKNGISPTSAYAGTRDTYLSQAAAGGNFGSAGELLADGDDPPGSGEDLASLIAWDLSDIPADALVESVGITINVFNPSSGIYDLYEVLRGWDEGEATWTQAANGASWQTAGAKGASDRGTTVLGSVSASSTGSYSLNLNAEGLAVVQGWINGTTPNYGFMLANSATTDGLDFDSSQSSTADRPELTVTYSVPPSSSDTEPPTSPGNLQQTAVTTTSAMLAWDAATDNVGVVGYKIYREAQLVGTLTGTAYEDTGLQPGADHGYTVTAYDAANNESVPAGPLFVTTETVPLLHVQDIALQMVDEGATRYATSQVTVLDEDAQPVEDANVLGEWSGLASATVSDVTLIDGTVGFLSDAVPSAVFGQLMFTVTGVSAAGFYYDEAGNGETTDCITTQGSDCQSSPGTPSAPNGLIASGGIADIGLDWEDSADSAVTEYTVYRSTTSLSGYQPLASISASAYTDVNISAGLPYFYVVVAYYDSGAISHFSNEAWAIAGAATLGFQNGVFPVTSYAGARDTYIAQVSPTDNTGSAVDLMADGDDPPGSGNDLSTLIAWDLTAIPQGAAIQSAAVTLEVFNRSTGSYGLYEIKRDWNEAEVTWDQAAAGSAWNQSGALGPDDRGSEVLATFSAGATGTYSVDLGAAGLAVLQAWIDGERPNNGFILADPGTTDGIDFHSSEAATAANRPKLTVTYTVTAPNQAPTASITASPTAGEAPLAVGFDAAASNDSDGSIVSYAWDFGDGTYGSGATTSHTYATAGNFAASLTVTDDDGATDSATAGITVTLTTATGPAVETGTVAGVSSLDWTMVTLPRSYESMIVVASANYDEGSVPGVTRIRNAEGGSFEVRADAAANGGVISGVTVHYVVAEEGSYNVAEHGVAMEAVKFSSTVTDRSGSWVGEARGYANTYDNPVVIGQVMTDNDPRFSVFWARGSSRRSPPSADSLYVGKHVGEDPARIRADETIGYLVIEAGSGSVSGQAYEAGLGADSVGGITNSPPYSYPVTDLATPSVAVLSAAGMDGGNGGWPLLYGTDPLTGGQLQLVYDEDQVNDTERSHTTEQVGYILFE